MAWRGIRCIPSSATTLSKFNYHLSLPGFTLWLFTFWTTPNHGFSRHSPCFVSTYYKGLLDVFSCLRIVKGTCKVVGLTRYLLPCKQTAVVEEGQEPELLPREVPDYLPLRILALLVASWLVCLVSILSISTAPFITGMQLREMLKLPIV